MPEKISLVKESGENISSNIVSIFLIPETGKRYIITTENAVDPHGLTVLHASELQEDKLVKIANDEEWSTIKTIMRAIISGNVGSYQYLPVLDRGKIDGQYSRDISVSATAAKQMADSYAAADKTEVVPDEVEKVEEETPASTIFPTGENNNTAEENEVSPGIEDTARKEEPKAVQQVEQPPEEKKEEVQSTDLPQPEPTPQPVEQVQQQVPVQQAVEQVQQTQQVQQGPVQPVQYEQQVVVDPMVGSQISMVGTTNGYASVLPYDSSMMYAYAQQYYPQQLVNQVAGNRNVNLEPIIKEAQNMLNESIRNIVYMVNDRIQQQMQYQQPMNNQMYQGYGQQPMMSQQYMAPYVQPMVVQASNDSNR